MEELANNTINTKEKSLEIKNKQITQPKVSVIIPVYNVEKYLRECLDSVVNQTLKDIEIICINDGSTDKSGEILNEYAYKDSRIIVINQYNSGAGAARNAGLAIAKGNYLAILDSDDIYNTSMLEKMYKKASKQDLDIVICRCSIFNQTKNHTSRTNHTIVKKYLPKKETFNCTDIPQHIIGFCIGWTWDKLYKRSFVEKYKLTFPQIHNSEDGMFVFLSLCLADRISIIKDYLVIHRINTKTQLSERRDEAPFCFIEGALALKKALEKYNIYSMVEQSYINWFVEHSFWHLDTLNLKNSHDLEVILYKLFEEMGVYNHNADYFYEYNNYEKLKFMINKIPYDVCKQISNFRNNKNKTHQVINLFGIKIKIRRGA